MKQLATIGAVLCLAASLSFAENWNGKLIDYAVVNIRSIASEVRKRYASEAALLSTAPARLLTMAEYEPALVGWTLFSVRVELVNLFRRLVPLKNHW